VKLSENAIREIADWLQCGLECWIHKAKGTMYFLPNLEDPFFDPEQWKEVLEELQGREDEFLVFQKMDSSHAFRVMEEFTLSLPIAALRTELEAALSGSRPFHCFTSRVEMSKQRENWYNYRFDAHMDWVKSQVNCYELVY
jgi:hypothetical protein